MDPERWRRVNELFHAALDRDPSERDAYLADACADDRSLGDEVRALVAAHAEADRFDRPAYAADPGLMAEAAGGDTLSGRPLGPYRVVGLLGRGGMGVVYLGEDTRLRRPVAIKALPAAVTGDAQLRARLRREAMAAAALSHPNIATVFALEEFDGQLYLVREYVAGRTLRQEMASGRMPVATAQSIIESVARALAAAHARGIIHRDLKPENVMRTATGEVKVVDFGLARFEGETETALERLTRPGAVLGTPGYMAPELLRGDPADGRADQFAVGVMLYELLTGRHPFAGASTVSTIARILESDPPPLVVTVRSEAPAALDEIIRRCLGRRPADRYTRTDELVAALESSRVASAAATRESGASPSSAGVTPAGDVAPAHAPAARWWWQFHQLAVSAVYVLALVPLWRAREWMPGRWGLVTFIAAVAVVGVAANLRLHLWFTSRVYPTELDAQQGLASRWRRAADSGFALLLLATAAVVAEAQSGLAAGLIALAVSSVISARLVEPATTRAAFRRD